MSIRLHTGRKLNRGAVPEEIPFQQSPHPRFICDRHNYRLLSANPAAVSQYGHSDEEFLALTAKDLCDPGDVDAFTRHCRARRSRQHADRVLLRHRTRRGALMDVELRSIPVRFGGQDALLLQVLDITKQRQAERRLRAQHVIAQALAESASVAEACPKIFQAICESLGCDWGELWRVDEQRRMLRCEQVWSPPGARLGALKAVTQRATFAFAQGLPGLVWWRNRPLWISDLRRRPNLPHAAVAAENNLRTVFAFPIRLGDEVLGVIAVYRREALKPDKALLQMLKTTTNHIGQMMGRRRAERRLLAISEREQERIGQDLHDSVCQELAGISFRAKDLRDMLAAQGRAEQRDAAQIAELSDRALTHTRQLAHGLKPVKSEPGGLMTALAELTETIGELFSVSCRWECPVPVLVNDHAVANHLYRIAQEAIHNAITHGKADHVVVALTRRPGTLKLTVWDNGTGMAARRSNSDGIGLEIMQHRAREIGAHLTIHSRVGNGTTVACAVATPREESP